MEIKKYLQLIILVLASGAIYKFIYLRTSFAAPIMEVYGIREADLSYYYTIIGAMFVVGYAPSGWIADRFSSKWLVTISLAMIGLIGIVFAQVSNPKILPYIYFSWGIFAVFTFWGALMRSVKILTGNSSHGKSFGILDGGRGLVEALLVTVAAIIFSNSMNNNSEKESLQYVIYFFSITCFVIAILAGLFLQDEKIKVDNNQEDSVLTILKKHDLWLLSGVIFAGYMAYFTIIYFSSYLVENQGFSVSMAASVTAIMLWLRPISGVVIGYIGDRFGIEKVMSIILALGAFFLIILAFLPTLSTGIIIILVGITATFLYLIRGLYWSLLGNIKLSPKSLGLAIGVVSFIGYLPDVIAPQLVKIIANNTDNNSAMYSIYFIISAIISLLGIYFTIKLKKISNKNLKHTSIMI